jgi:hypothetical protein
MEIKEKKEEVEGHLAFFIAIIINLLPMKKLMQIKALYNVMI